MQIEALQKDDFTVINGGTNENAEDTLRIHEFAYVNTKDMAIREIFGGFDKLQAITFSFGLDYIDEIVQMFSYAEIIFGGKFLAEKSNDLQKLTAQALVLHDEAAQEAKKYPRIYEKMQSGNMELRTSALITDHRKLYLLSSDDGSRHRVIFTSANMSRRAFEGDQLEEYGYCNDAEYFDIKHNEFDTAWQLAAEVPFSCLEGKKSGNKAKDNDLIKKAREFGSVTVAVPQDDKHIIERNEYFVEYNGHAENVKAYEEALKGTKLSAGENGLVEIKAKDVKRIETNFGKYQQKKIEIKNNRLPWPSLTFEIQSRNACFSDKENKTQQWNLSPPDEDVRHDIDLLLKYFENFGMFNDNRGNLRESYYRLLNIMFVSPFHAPLIHMLKPYGITTSAMKIFTVVTSDYSGSGKSRMIHLILKMMSGANGLNGINGTNMDTFRQALNDVKGMPVFFEEADGRFITSLAPNFIKNEDLCLNDAFAEAPMFVIAGNKLDIEQGTRRRLAYIKVNAALPSDVDINAMDGLGDSYAKKMGNSFYRRYFGLMLDEIKKLIDDIETNEPQKKDPKWYPDTVEISSKVLKRIFIEYGYEIPDYIRPLKWERDYGSREFLAKETLLDIVDLYNTDRECFDVKKNVIIIRLGSNDTKKVQGWEKLLPSEFKADAHSSRDGGAWITIDRKVLEEKTGLNFGRFSWRKKK